MFKWASTLKTLRSLDVKEKILIFRINPTKVVLAENTHFSKTNRP
jgi:hypothetical protein